MIVFTVFALTAFGLMVFAALQCGKNVQPPVVEQQFLDAELAGRVDYIRRVKGGVIFRLGGSLDTWFVDCPLSDEGKLLCQYLILGDSVHKWSGLQTLSVNRLGLEMDFVVFEAQWTGRHLQ